MALFMFVLSLLLRGTLIFEIQVSAANRALVILHFKCLLEALGNYSRFFVAQLLPKDYHEEVVTMVRHAMLTMVRHEDAHKHIIAHLLHMGPFADLKMVSKPVR